MTRKLFVEDILRGVIMVNNEKIKGIEDFSKGMWLNYDCKVAKEIPNRQFLMIKT